MKRALAQLTPRDRFRWTPAILERVRDLPAFANSRRVLCCLSFDAEVNTWPLVDWLRRTPGKTVWVPRCTPGEPLMTVHEYPCELEALSFGLHQPTAAVPAIPPSRLRAELDCVCILGLAFDPVSGYRLGRGGGHFDRFLAAYPTTALGLAFERQLLRGLPHDDWDLPMDYLVTEKAVYTPRGETGDDANS